MRIGFHISIAGGLFRAVARAEKLQCETMQLFCQSPRSWAGAQLDEHAVAAFKKARLAARIAPLAVHMPYLPNLATTRDDLYRKSVEALCHNLQCAHQLGADYLVVHPGNRGDDSVETACGRVAHALNQALEQVPTKTVILIENAAGQGSEICNTFEDISAIIRAVKKRARLGMCLDTAHAFAAGYDIASKKGLDNTLNILDKTVGIKRLRLLHLNDSKTPLGSRADRHWHIGRGHIGLSGFRRIVNHPLLKNLAGIMETPKKTDADEIMNMETIRKLMK